MELISSTFPPGEAAAILNINISNNTERDCLMWAPSTTGTFYVRSSYRVNLQDRLSGGQRVERKVWQKVWDSKLHERHKHCFWRSVLDMIPTKCRLGSVLRLEDLSFYLCERGRKAYNI